MGTVTAIGLNSRILGLLFLGSIFVIEISQSSLIFSLIALLKHFTAYLLISASFIRNFIISALIPSTPVAFPFFILFIVLVNSSSPITGNFMISESASFSSSSILSISPPSLCQNEKSGLNDFWYILYTQVPTNFSGISIISFLSPSSLYI